MATVSEIKAKVGSVVYGKGKLPELLGAKIIKFYDNIERIIYTSLHEFGEIMRDEIRLELMSMTGSGRKYKYVDKKGNTLFEWTASSPNDLPAAVSEKLANAIEYKVLYGKETLGTFEIGVYSNEPGGMFPTIAFKGGPSRTKKGKLKKGEEEGVGKLFVVEGKGTQTPLDKIAEYLEHGTEKMAPRPFLKPLFIKYLEQYKKEIRQMMRRELISAMGVGTLTTYFRFYLRENK